MQEQSEHTVCGAVLLKREPIQHMESHLSILAVTVTESSCALKFLYCILNILV